MCNKAGKSLPVTALTVSRSPFYVISNPINDDMATRWKDAMLSRKFGSGMANLGILVNGQKRLIK